MAKHRTLVPVTYVNAGAAVSVAANRIVDLDDTQAKALAGKVALIESQDSMFPDGTPIIPPAIVRAEVATTEVVSVPAPVPTPKPVAGPSGK